jgi:serine/threonine protein kinase
VPPPVVGPWEILSVAGRGGVGTVYRARHRRSGELAAVKLLGPPPAADPTAARRLAREYEALRGLEHPNIVHVLDVGVSEGWSYLAMELVEGLDLRSYLSPAVELGAPLPRAEEADLAPPAEPLSTFSEEPDTESLVAPLEQGPAAILAFAARMEEPDTDAEPTPPDRAPAPPRAARAKPRGEARPPSDEVLALLNAPSRVARLRDAFRQLCEGLRYIHACGLVHRDLKPSNVMVDDRRRVRIMDFGLVKLARESASLTLHGKIVGTYRYMAPEQARGFLVDARTDLYSAGVVLFELLCGRPPFLAERPADLWTEITDRPAPSVAALNPRADPALAAVAERLLRKDPAERFQGAAEVLAAIGG